ncbi:uncharacterized protein PAC_03857 [Phialocephala subalpina]|uniref:FAD-binding PCMH-type domain-containing protein n=1 Tax=Phialocephala subalpina TaxID=576137 RepID=A0A1L7WMF9_9HELO|nr:uncharacterized protein PAC_03857 [Phialocephala subalpina]
MAGLLSSVLEGVLGVPSAILGAPSPVPSGGMAACAAIAANTQVQMESWPVNQYTSQYSTARTHYWNAANADRTPACVVLPQNAQDVSDAIRVLLGYPDIGVAVKSGGHNANVGFSSTDGGVLISMANSNSTTISPDLQTAYLSPGATWAQTLAALEPYGKAAVGGRIGDVGVGGLLLGCGLSFLSALYGLPCDNILNYEVVLSNASIVNANATSNTDLFWALKGGGDQFGIVTKFTVRTVPIGQVWGGYRTYSSNYASQILNLTQDFTANFPDLGAGIIVTLEIVASNLDQFVTVFFFYNGPNPPPGSFDKFLSLPFTADTTKTWSYSSMLASNANVASVYGLRYLLRGTTIPNLPSTNGTDLVNANYNNFVSYVLKLGLLKSFYQFVLIYQPMPYAIPAASERANPLGNLLGLSTNYGDQMWMASTVSWLTSDGDSSGRSMITDIINDVASYVRAGYPNVKASNFQSGDLQAMFAPATFMNDAMSDQPVLQGYGNATYQRLKSVQKEYDPIGFFPGRTNGFKLT